MQDAAAGGARRIRRGQLRADVRHLRLNALERFVVTIVLVPRCELLADALQRPAVALVEGVGAWIEIADDLERGFFDARGILRREVDHGVDVARTPLQACGVAFGRGISL